MIVTRTRGGNFNITGITFAELEDLISAYDSGNYLFVFGDRDLYGGSSDPMLPIRKAIADAQATIGET